MRDIVQYSGKPNERNGQWAGTLEQWLEQPYPAEPDLRLALEALAWSHGLPDLAQVLTALRGAPDSSGSCISRKTRPAFRWIAIP